MLTKLLPCNIVQSVWADSQPAISKYTSLLDPSLTVIKAEYILWQQHWTDDKQSVALLPANAFDSLNHCSAKSYPNMHLLLKVLATLPVSTATPERVFSKLERKLTALRPTMTEDRIEALVLIQARRDRVISLLVDNVISKFTECGSRRLGFDFPLQHYYKRVTATVINANLMKFCDCVL